MTRAKPTREEHKRRRDYVVEWSIKGCSVQQIATALGVSAAVVSADRVARRHQLEGHQVHTSRRKYLPPDPPAYDWITPPPPPVQRSYEINSALPRIRHLLSYLQESNARSRLPHNIEEARKAADQAWYQDYQLVLQDTVGYLQDLQGILQDKGARIEAEKPEARDDLRRPNAQSVAQESALPRQGAGELPSRVFQIMIAYDWAGLEVTDEVIANIARKEHSTTGRVRRAAAEYARRKEQESR